MSIFKELLFWNLGIFKIVLILIEVMKMEVDDN